MTLSPVLIVCAKAPLNVVSVPAVRVTDPVLRQRVWECSWCGGLVKVIA